MRGVKAWGLLGFLFVIGLAVDAQAKTREWAWRRAVGFGHTLESLTRTQLPGGIAEYQVVVRVGNGRFDKIRVTRVIREIAPWVPVRADEAVMLIHGSLSTFETAFLPGVVTNAFPETGGMAYYFADQGIDVWGIDLRWTFVPIETEDFSFMRDWGLATHVADTRLAAKIARLVRGLTGSGFGRLFLSGHSLGGEISYALAGDETRFPDRARDVRGLIPIEMTYKHTSEETRPLREAAAVRYEAYKGLWDSGTYVYSNVAPIMLAQYALEAPNDPSSLIPGMTNRQAALFVSCMTFAADTLPPYTPGFHHTQCAYDENGLPTDTVNIDSQALLRLITAFVPYETMLEEWESNALLSDAVDSPYDDRLARIKVPVFYVGVAGGFGAPALETLPLLGSRDKSSLIVQTLGPGQEAFDYGHIDLLYGRDAPELIWQPMVDWMRSH